MWPSLRQPRLLPYLAEVRSVKYPTFTRQFGTDLHIPTPRQSGGGRGTRAGRSSDEPGVAQVLDEDPVDEGVLGQGLNHHHPLITQLGQDGSDLQRLDRVNR